MNQEKIKVLIIDDDIVDQLAIKRSIKLSGYFAQIDVSDNATDGLNKCFTDDYDAIFVDYILPGEDGLVFLKKYKENGGNAPVIITTSYGDEQTAVQAIKLGASDYIPKSALNIEGVSKCLKYASRLKEIQVNTSKVEQALIETERQLKVVIDKSPLILFSINVDGIFTLFKGRGIDHLGLEESDVVGKSVFDIWNKLPFSITHYKNAILGNELKHLTEFNGRYYEMHFIPVRNEKSDLIGMMGVATDVTGHKEQERELNNTIALAEETKKVKEQFLANMSHEIRTPIHGIISLVNILMKTQLETEQSGYLKAIQKSADNLLVIINDILDMSKIEADKMTFENVCFNLEEAAKASLDLFKVKAEEKGLKLNFQFKSGAPSFVKGDPTRLSQIINNLMGNAIKFTHQGNVTLTIEQKENNEKFAVLTFKVIDTGIGIAPQKLSGIFESFTQAGDDITRKYGGTGLGLSISKKLIELQGGIIYVESELNKGTSFVFNLPFQMPEQGETETSQKTVSDKHENFKKPIRLLVVEDNDINRLIINKHIADWGFIVDNVTNGIEAIDMIKSKEFDVVLMDIEMPKMNGYQATEKIRTTLDESRKNIPILAMTAHATTAEKDKCLQAGMNDYISKPFNPLDVKNKIIDLVYPELRQTKAELVEEKKPVQEEKKEQRLTNLDFLRSLSENNNSFFKDFIELFLNQTPPAIDELKKYLAEKNWEMIRQAAHKMKPSLNYIGLKALHETVANLESFAKQQINLDEFPEMINEIETTCKAAFSELEKELKSISV